MTELGSADSPLNNRDRVTSIDAFRGFTVLAMVFVIQVAGYSNLPLTQSWFGSPPVSTFHHAADAAGNATGIGLTFTDLVAPFFVFIVGLVLPLSRKRRGSEWWNHVLRRTLFLIVLGALYISLIFGLSYWWGILQAIGVAYFLGASAMFLPRNARWALAFGIAGLHLLLTHTLPWWTHLGEPGAPFLTIANLHGDPLRPLTVHCTPWASISYGVIAIVGTLLGDAVATRSTRTIIRHSLLIGIVFGVVGYMLHRLDWPLFAMNKETVSASYALFTSGVAGLTFLLFYLILDVARAQTWAWPLIVFGSNALLGYFLQPIVRNFVFALGFREYLSGYSGWDGMLVGLIWTAVLWAAIYWCNRHNLYWRI
jgi:predicted acyltransferase